MYDKAVSAWLILHYIFIQTQPFYLNAVSAIYFAFCVWSKSIQQIDSHKKHAAFLSNKLANNILHHTTNNLNKP